MAERSTVGARRCRKKKIDGIHRPLAPRAIVGSYAYMMAPAESEALPLTDAKKF